MYPTDSCLAVEGLEVPADECRILVRSTERKLECNGADALQCGATVADTDP